jgi:glycosyltransferase involved in cell wall biosynthesis
MPTSYIRKLYKHYVRQIAKRADAILSVSESVKEALNTLNVNSIVVYDSLSIHEKYPAVIQKSKPASLTLLYLANFISGKGHNFAIEAFAEAQKQVPNLRMIMAGGDLGLKKNVLYKIELEKRVIALGLANRISFHDYVEDVEKFMKEGDVVLNFSESESFSLTCLEALTYGIPLIASDSGGPKELFENEKSGMLVPNRDIEKMATAMVRLCKNKELRENFGKESRVYACKKFDLTRNALALHAVYKQINQ